MQMQNPTMHSHVMHECNACRPPDPYASECEMLTLSDSVWFTLRVLMACPLRHSTFLFAAYISMPSFAEATGSGEAGRGQSGANKCGGE